MTSENTMRCPRCGWVSVTKISDCSSNIMVLMEESADCFVCTNPKCGVERIYGEGVFLVVQKEKKE